MVQQKRKRKAPAPSTNGYVEKPEDERPDLSEPWSQLYGGKDIKLPMISDLPGHTIPVFCGLNMQQRACELTGGPDDPDLIELYLQDFMTMMIGRDREGRREGVKIAFGQQQREAANAEADLWGRGG